MSCSDEVSYSPSQYEKISCDESNEEHSTRESNVPSPDRFFLLPIPRLIPEEDIKKEPKEKDQETSPKNQSESPPALLTTLNPRSFFPHNPSMSSSYAFSETEGDTNRNRTGEFPYLPKEVTGEFPYHSLGP